MISVGHVGMPEPLRVQDAEKGGPISKAVDWLDRRTTPHPDTLGDFDGPAYFQAGFQGVVEGFALRGLMGSLSSGSAALAGVFVEDKTGSNVAGVIAGTVVGAGLAALTSLGRPEVMATNILTGALLGAFQTYRGNGKSRVRDSGGNATMLAAIAGVKGPAKVAGGIAAAVAERWGPEDKPWVKAAIGGAIGLGMGAALASIGFSPASMLVSTLACGGAGAIGPFFGPRFSQFFRNLSKDAGGTMEKGLMKAGVIDEPMNPKWRNCMGAIPSSFVKEGTRGLLYADGSIIGLLTGGVAETIQQFDIFLNSKPDPNANPTPAPGPAPAAPTVPGSQPPPPDQVIQQPAATQILQAAVA